jgi:hypothetical protein
VPNEEDWQTFFNEFSDDAKMLLRLFVNENVDIEIQKEAVIEHRLIKCMAVLYSDGLLQRTPFITIRNSVMSKENSLDLVQ